MKLSDYHKKYLSYPDEEIQNRVKEKRGELANIFKEIKFSPISGLIKIAVLGCV